jgi:hypothetical protein
LPAVTDAPLCLLLLPRELDGFILQEQVEDLARSPGVRVVGPPRPPYGVVARLPGPAGALAARLAAADLRRRAALGRAVPAVVVIFHAIQEPVARALRGSGARPAELWYGRWDRYECAYDADPRMRARLARLHERAAAASALTFAASSELVRLEREAGRDAVLVELAAGDFPAPDPTPPTTEELSPFAGIAEAVAGAEVVAFSLGHLGRRCDWALLRAVCERVPGLVLLLVGEWHDDECADDEDYAWCRASEQIAWLGRRDDAQAATLLRASDVGIVPFRREPFNDAGLPYRIVKYAKLGRRTITPELAGVLTWGHAVTRCSDAEEWADALRGAAGARTRPDMALREWALAQTAAKVNAPLRARLERLGVGSNPSDERRKEA